MRAVSERLARLWACTLLVVKRGSSSKAAERAVSLAPLCCGVEWSEVEWSEVVRE